MVLPQSVSCTLSAVWRDAAGILPTTKYGACSKVLLAGAAVTLILFDLETEEAICTVEVTDPASVLFYQQFAEIGETLARALVAS